jgi:hypothetical protein
VGQSALQQPAPLEKEFARVETSVPSFAAKSHCDCKLSVEALRIEGRCSCNEPDEPASPVSDVGEPTGLSLKVEDLRRSWKF